MKIPGMEEEVTTPKCFFPKKTPLRHRSTSNNFHHHHHVHEGLGVLCCSLILKVKLVPPSLPHLCFHRLSLSVGSATAENSGKSLAR
jgi:hypothetical protein